MHNPQLDNPFWQFACNIYQKADVRDILLKMQDEHNLNINMLLLMCWLGNLHVKINQEQLIILIESINEMDINIIQPLRQARRSIKSDPTISPDCYHKCKHLEVQMEQRLIGMLYQESLNLAQDIVKLPCVEHNIKTYIDHFGFGTLVTLTSYKDALLKVL